MIINDCKLPDCIHAAISKNTYVPRGYIGPSSLSQGVRQIIGRKRFTIKSELASRMWRTFTGTCTHLALEELLKDDPDFITEIPLEASFNEVSKFKKLPEDITIGGTSDLYQVSKAKLSDYKTMATTGVIDDDKIAKWEAQINIYRFLALTTKKIETIKELSIVVFLMDWTPTKAIRSKDVDDIPCIEIPIRMWSREECETYIHDKVSQILQYKDADWDSIPYCSPEERWNKPAKYSVCKVQPDGTLGNQLPKCGFNNKEDAVECLEVKQLKAKKGDQYDIRFTPEVNTMCEDWCSLGREGYCDFVRSFNENNN